MLFILVNTLSSQPQLVLCSYSPDTSGRTPAHPLLRLGLAWDRSLAGTLTCHSFQSYQEADQAGEADPTSAVTVPQGHEVQQLTADGDACKEVWPQGELVNREEVGLGKKGAPLSLEIWEICSECSVTSCHHCCSAGLVAI